MTSPSVEVTTDSVPAVVVTVPGPQGPKGVDNVHVGPNPPENPVPGMVWIQTNA